MVRLKDKGNNGYYPLGDVPRIEARAYIREKDESIRIPSKEYWSLLNSFYAKSTGEKRPPKKGEWYLSGAEVHAYRAPNDLSTPYVIAKLVLAKKVTTTVIVELGD